MNIQEMIDKIKVISLNHKEIKSFYVGNTWNMSGGKGDVYPAVWVELPVLVGYSINNRKTYTFSFDVLMLPKNDDVNDEVFKISQCEAIADQLLQAFKSYLPHSGIESMDGLSVKNINADTACGVRIDIRLQTNRECEILYNFNEEMDRI